MVEIGASETTDGAGFEPWRPGERESFFAAIDRNRRASWQITGACAIAIGVLAVVVAVLLAPLLVGIVGLAIDLVNLVVPMPDVLGAIGRRLDVVLDEKTFTIGALVSVTALAAIPGLVLMAIAVFVLHRALARSPLFIGSDSIGRTPQTDLDEQRLRNVIEEMAIAATLPVPTVRIVPAGANASAFGRDDAHATILVGEGMLAGFERAELQGAMAHLLGSIADGDMKIGMRAALTFSLFGLMTRISSCFGDRSQIYDVAKLLRSLVWPTQAGTERLIEQMADPFRDTKRAPSAASSDRGRDETANALTWREWLMMPLVGPVVMSGFLGGMVSEFLLRPLVSLAWRRRKYMADAVGVRLTRDPDAMASLLARLASANVGGLAAWAQHLAIAGVRQRGLLDGGFVPIFPALDARLRALVRMGATVTIAVEPPWYRAMPAPLLLLFGALGALVALLLGVVVVLLVWVSLALSGLFTLVPVAALHALLRAV